MKHTNSKKAFIFDLDGVIVDTAKYHFLAWRRLANELGFDFGAEKNEELKGVGRIESLELILSWANIELPKEEIQQLAERKNKWYQEYISQMDASEILPGVIDFLEESTQLKILMAVGSGSKNATTIVHQVGIAHYFASIVDGNRLSRSKPDPQVFQLAAADLGLPPEACIVFEDAASGIDAAIAGNFTAIGIGDEANLGHAHLVLQDFVNLHPQAFIANVI